MVFPMHLNVPIELPFGSYQFLKEEDKSDLRGLLLSWHADPYDSGKQQSQEPLHLFPPLISNFLIAKPLP